MSRLRLIVWVLVFLVPFSGCWQRMDKTRNQETAHQKAAPASTTQGEEQQPGQAIKRLRPSAFPELPLAIRRKLGTHGCLIPQVAEIAGRHNVIRGQFCRKGQMDWAVLCTKGGKFFILVFWARPCRCPAQLELEADPTFLQTGSEPIGYDRYISTVNKAYILQHYEWYGGPVPPPLDHEGINAGFAGKGSDVYYCYRGKWLLLQGAD
jgi:hypothetical protein